MTEVYSPKKPLNLDKPPSITINGETVEVKPCKFCYSERARDPLDRANLKRNFKELLFSDNDDIFISFALVPNPGNFSEQEKRDILGEVIEERRAENEKKNKKIEK